MPNIAYIINIIILIAYFIFADNKMVWPNQFVFWVWLPYLGYAYLNHFIDGLQNTARNIARIYLIKELGVNYDKRQIQPIQHLLIPDNMFFRTILWDVFHVSGFFLVLFYQGWATALIAEVTAVLIGFVIPINYQSHLRRIQQNFSKDVASKPVKVTRMGISTKKIQQLLNQGVDEKKNPQYWWAETLKESHQN